MYKVTLTAHHGYKRIANAGEECLFAILVLLYMLFEKFPSSWMFALAMLN